MMSFTPLFLLLIFVIISPIQSNNIVDLIQTIRNKNSNANVGKRNSFDHHCSFFIEILVGEFRQIIQTIQDHLYNTTSPSK